jgi:predicted nucleic acid-binding protein
MSDCVAAATAVQLDLELATSDQLLADLASNSGVRVIPIANSRGVQPTVS